MNIAKLFAEKSTCDRARVGCVMVRDGRIISTGFNGSIAGQPHCDDDGHLLIEGHCIRTVHAEVNAIVFAAKNGIETNKAVVYTTHYPCAQCTKLLIVAGIKKIYYDIPYRMDENPFKHLIKLEQVKEEIVKTDFHGINMEVNEDGN